MLNAPRDDHAESLSKAMKAAINTLHPYYSRKAIAAKLNLGRGDDQKRGGKSKAKAVRDFLNQRRTSKRLSPLWINFAYAIQEMLLENLDRDATVRAEASVFS